MTTQDYARAAQWRRPSVLKMVKNLFIIPHWIGNTDKFWYKHETQEGHEYVLVDAGSGEKRPLFNHQELAGALTRSGLDKVDHRALSLESIQLNDTLTVLDFDVEDTHYRCGLKPLSCDQSPGEVFADNILVSPDKKLGAFTRNENLWIRDLVSGAERALTHDGIEDFGYGIYHDNWEAIYIQRLRDKRLLPPMATQWSPDSRKILVSRIDQRHVAPYPFVSTAPNDGSFRPILYQPRIPLLGEKAVSIEWFIIDIDTNKMVRLDLPYEKLLTVHQDLLPLLKTWWADNNNTLFTVAHGDNLEAAYFFEIDLRNGKTKTILQESIHPRTDLNSTSYNEPNVEFIRETNEFIWFSQRSGWGHLYLYDSQTGKLKNAITQGDWLVRDIIEVDKQRRRIFFTAGGREAGNPYYRYLYRVNFDGSELKLLSPEKADHLLIGGRQLIPFDGAKGYDAISPSGQYVVYNYSTIDQPTRTVIRKTTDGSLVSTVSQADVSRLYSAGWRNPEAFTVKAADGTTDLYGVIYKPANFDSKKKYPVIDSQYASPLTAVVPQNFYMAIMSLPGVARTASLSELGFVCVVVDARGTTYRSKKFSHYSFGNLNTNGLEDHVAAIKRLGQRHPWMDLTRVGIQGKSYGGFSSIRAMLEFPDFFKVGVSSAGVGNLSTMYPDYHFLAYHGEPIYGNGSKLRPTPEARPVNYENNDSVLQISKLQGKLLLLMGELDENVPPASNMQLVDALIKQDKDFDMLLIPNMNHKLRTPYSIRYVWNYFVEHLLGTEAPANFRMTTLPHP